MIVVALKTGQTAQDNKYMRSTFVTYRRHFYTMKWSVVFAILVFIFCSKKSVVGQVLGLSEGESCKTEDGIPGSCKFITQCRQVLEQVHKGKLPRILCGFMGSQSIVCCPDNRATTPNTITTKSTTTTTSSVILATKRPTTTSRNTGDISREKCKEYAEYVYDMDYSPTLSIHDDFTHSNECPFDKETLIVGGTKASRKEFPHMAQLGYKTGSEIAWACGGSLISQQFILTAAHCLQDHSLGLVKFVRVGITNITDLRHVQERPVQQLFKHPDYVNKYHDIGLIKVASPFKMDTYVRPACLQVEKEIPFKNAIASGFGNIQFTGDSSKDLLKVVLEMFSIPKCNKTYRREINQPDSPLKNGIDEDLMMCAGSSVDLKDTCQGDSGGPLQIYREDTDEIKCMYSIIGITSFGKSCGLAKNVPGVYTRVSTYVKWIEDIVWA